MSFLRKTKRLLSAPFAAQASTGCALALLFACTALLPSALAQGLPGARSPLLSAPKFLPAEQAFAYFVSLPAANVVAISWQIAPGYYLYKDKFALNVLVDGKPAKLHAAFPEAVPHHDEFFGDVQVYFNEVTVQLTLTDADLSGDLSLLLEFQGCAEAGFCYTLQRREEPLLL